MKSMMAALSKILALALAASCVVSTSAFSQSVPDWWAEYDLFNSNSADDYAVINQGQLKNFALAAYLMLDDALPEGAGDGLHVHISQFYDLSAGEPVSTSATDDFAVTNQGQLKAIAKPFYDRLIAEGYITLSGSGPGLTSSYPWLSSGQQTGPGTYPWERAGAADNFAAANIGQAKFLFSFNPSLDSDEDGLPDWWELEQVGDLTTITSGSNVIAADSISYQEAYQLGVTLNGLVAPDHVSSTELALLVHCPGQQ